MDDEIDEETREARSKLLRCIAKAVTPLGAMLLWDMIKMLPNTSHDADGWHRVNTKRILKVRTMNIRLYYLLLNKLLAAGFVQRTYTKHGGCVFRIDFDTIEAFRGKDAENRTIIAEDMRNAQG